MTTNVSPALLRNANRLLDEAEGFILSARERLARGEYSGAKFSANMASSEASRAVSALRQLDEEARGGEAVTNEELKAECLRLAGVAFPRQKIASVRVSIHCYDADKALVAGYSSSPGGGEIDLAALRVLAGEEPKAGGLTKADRQLLADVTEDLASAEEGGLDPMLTCGQVRGVVELVKRLAAQTRPESELVGKLSGLVAKWRADDAAMVEALRLPALYEAHGLTVKPRTHADELEALIGDNGGDDV